MATSSRPMATSWRSNATLRTAPMRYPGHRFADPPAHEVPLVLRLKAQNLGDGLADIGIAHRRGVGKASFEIGSDCGHEVHGFGAAEAAMHALTLLQAGVGDL